MFNHDISRYVQGNKWQDALGLCRNADDNILWVCLAVLATQAGADHLDIAEEAFAVINHYDKVLYLQHLKVNKSNRIAPYYLSTQKQTEFLVHSSQPVSVIDHLL